MGPMIYYSVFIVTLFSPYFDGDGEACVWADLGNFLSHTKKIIINCFRKSFILRQGENLIREMNKVC